MPSRMHHEKASARPWRQKYSMSSSNREYLETVFLSRPGIVMAGSCRHSIIVVVNGGIVVPAVVAGEAAARLLGKRDDKQICWHVQLINAW